MTTTTADRGRSAGASGADPLDRHGELDADRVVGAPPLLAAFGRAGVLAAADVHVATTLGRLTGEDDEEVLLAAALAVRGPRLGNVCIDVLRVRSGVAGDEEALAAVAALPWPADPAAWVAAVARSPLVQHREPAGTDGSAGPAPLRLQASLLYLDRYWRYEQRVLCALQARGGVPADGVDRPVLREGLDRLYPTAPVAAEGPDLQRLAAATAVLQRLAVVAGGPGTGKTHTVATVLALLHEQAAATGAPAPRVALAAPTGKAAARMEEAIAKAAGGLATTPVIRQALLGLRASTLHRLLGRRPGSQTRFRHHAGDPLPADVVVVDETSMVSLSLMAKLLDALRPETRLVLLGDPDQLFSVEAGAVLGDVVGDAMRLGPDAAAALADVAGHAPPADAVVAGERPSRIGDGIVVLQRVHRFARGSGIAGLAAAIRDGDADAAVGVLRDGGVGGDLRWVEAPAEPAPGWGQVPADAGPLGPVRAAAAVAARAVLGHAERGEALEALAAAEALRVLCAHRRGTTGASTWVEALERWLAADVDGYGSGGAWYLGRPVLVTENDYQLGLYNGDVGVVVRRDSDRPAVAFPAAEGVRWVSPSRLEAVQTVHAMTIHKSQGSQFAAVVVALPPPGSPILTRELLYTGVTRAREALTVVGTEEALRAGIERRVQRASGLRAALWGT